VILMASGTEVHLVIEAAEQLASQGRNVRVVSFPSWELFTKQGETYQNQVLLPSVRARVAVEAGVPMGWEKWVGEYGEIIGIKRFGASAPYKVIYDQFGLTPGHVVEAAIAAIERVSEKE